MLNEVVINSVDDTDYVILWEVLDDFGSNVREAMVEIDSSVATPPVNGNSITIKRGAASATEEFVFDGYIDEITVTGERYIIKAKDKLLDLIKNEVTYSYDSNIDASSGKISEIFKDLINTHGGGVLSADATSIQDSGSVLVLTRFICNHEDVFKKCQELADLINWQFYYTASTGLVYFEPKGFLGLNGSLTVGTDLENDLEWIHDASEIANDITVFGATQEIGTEESGQLDVTSGWTSGDAGIGTLAEEPVSVKVWADVATPPTTLRTGGVLDSSETYDYAVDKQNKQLVWETNGGYAWTANHHVLVSYTYNIPVPVTGKNSESITSYGTFKKTYFFEGFKNVSDAENKLNELLEKYSVPFVNTVASPLTRYNLKSGQTVQVIDASAGEDRIMLVNKIVRSFPHISDTLELGDRIWKTSDWQTEVMDRILELETRLAKTSDFLVHVSSIKHSLVYQRDSLEIVSRSIGTAFILGHPVNGVLGTSALGSGTMSGWSQDYIIDY